MPHVRPVQRGRGLHYPMHQLHQGHCPSLPEGVHQEEREVLREICKRALDCARLCYRMRGKGNLGDTNILLHRRWLQFRHPVGLLHDPFDSAITLNGLAKCARSLEFAALSDYIRKINTTLLNKLLLFYIFHFVEFIVSGKKKCKNFDD